MTDQATPSEGFHRGPAGSRQRARKVVIAGGSGFLGRILRRHFHRKGWHIVVLTRDPATDPGVGATVRWDGATLGPWAAPLEGADVLINLSGKSVDCRYNAANKQAIYDSRLHSTWVLGEAMAACTRPPGLWINASSATIYRHAEDRDMDEATGEIGEGFSVDVCRQWERTFFEAPTPDKVRRAALRTAIVLGRDGGAFMPLRRLARLGLGGKMGNGRQYVSWLHEDDFAGIVQHVIDRESLTGVLNVAAPDPVTNAAFQSALRRACNAPIGIPTPAWLLEIGAALIGTETELILKSRRVVPGRLLASGYRFQFAELEAALSDLTMPKIHGKPLT